MGCNPWTLSRLTTTCRWHDHSKPNPGSWAICQDNCDLVDAVIHGARPSQPPCPTLPALDRLAPFLLSPTHAPSSTMSTPPPPPSGACPSPPRRPPPAFLGDETPVPAVHSTIKLTRRLSSGMKLQSLQSTPQSNSLVPSCTRAKYSTHSGACHFMVERPSRFRVRGGRSVYGELQSSKLLGVDPSSREMCPSSRAMRVVPVCSRVYLERATRFFELLLTSLCPTLQNVSIARKPPLAAAAPSS